MLPSVPEQTLPKRKNWLTFHVWVSLSRDLYKVRANKKTYFFFLAQTLIFKKLDCDFKSG